MEVLAKHISISTIYLKNSINIFHHDLVFRPCFKLHEYPIPDHLNENWYNLGFQKLYFVSIEKNVLNLTPGHNGIMGIWDQQHRSILAAIHLLLKLYHYTILNYNLAPY